MNAEVDLIFNKEIIIDKEKIPVAHLKYKGKNKTFVTWTLLEERPGLIANDEVLYSICSLDIDVFSDKNYTKIVKEIKKVMKNNDWVWVEDSIEQYEEDTKLYHKTISFEKERNIENG